MSRKGWIGLAVLMLGAGGWYAFRPERLFVNQKVNEQLSGSAVAVASGNFHGAAHETKGMATIYRLPDGRRTLRLTQFQTSNGPEVQVYLGVAADATDNESVTKAGFVTLGAMKGNIGDQNYDIPDGVDLSKYHSVTIWCHRFGVNFGTAPLS
ncbi:MAG TPA: DM13 domain-containing protein [Thermoanaerobaculia bacterium]|nr:DM13 domain-containing protein [Thermoanaerobaculia bacterium]